jgi:hypothetical protein
MLPCIRMAFRLLKTPGISIAHPRWSATGGELKNGGKMVKSKFLLTAAVLFGTVGVGLWGCSDSSSSRSGGQTGTTATQGGSSSTGQSTTGSKSTGDTGTSSSGTSTKSGSTKSGSGSASGTGSGAASGSGSVTGSGSGSATGSKSQSGGSGSVD